MHAADQRMAEDSALCSRKPLCTSLHWLTAETRLLLSFTLRGCELVTKVGVNTVSATQRAELGSLCVLTAVTFRC